MFLNGQHAEVSNLVVSGVAVDVVDLLPRLQRPSEMLLHNPSVFKDSPSIDGDPLVGPMVVRSGFLGVALHRAETLGAGTTWREAERLFALLAGSGGASVVVCHLAPNGSETNWLSGGRSAEVVAPPAAILGRVHPIGAHGKGDAAMSAKKSGHQEYYTTEAGRSHRAEHGGKEPKAKKETRLK